jgi:hypothetical protein
MNRSGIGHHEPIGDVWIFEARISFSPYDIVLTFSHCCLLTLIHISAQGVSHSNIEDGLKEPRVSVKSRRLMYGSETATRLESKEKESLHQVNTHRIETNSFLCCLCANPRPSWV